MAKSEDERRLGLVLKHWVDHNVSHANDFDKWAKTANDLGLDSIYNLIDQAANLMNEANAALMEAASKLEES